MGAVDLANTLLGTSNIMREIYHPDYESVHNRHMGTLNKLLPMSKRRIDGDGINVQVETHNAYGSRYGRNIHGAFPDPATPGTQKYKVDLTEDATTNDLARLATSQSVSDLDLQRVTSKGAAAVADWVDHLMDQTIKDVRENEAIHQYVPTTGLLAQINGTPKKNDRRLYASCASITTTGGGKFQVDSGSLSFFPRGRYIDVYSSGGTYRFTVFVTDRNPRDLSIGVFGLDANGAPSTSVDISALADNDGLYVQDQKGLTPVSIAEWLAAPAATGDSFFGKDREAPDGRWMQPQRTGPTSEQTFDLSHVDSWAIECGYQGDDPNDGLIAMGRLELIQTFQNLVGADKFIQFPTDEQKGKLFAQYGFDGAIYRHAAVGRIMLKGDAMVPEKTLWFLKPGSWEMLHALPNQPFRWMEGDKGFWYRANSATASGGRTDIWRADGYTLHAVLCTRPWDNTVMENVAPSASVSAA